jgi:hypothetical protein
VRTADNKRTKAAIPLFLIIIIAAIALLAVVGGILVGTGVLGKGSDTDGVADVPAASSEITIADGEPFDGTIDNGKDNTEQETRFIEQHRAW